MQQKAHHSAENGHSLEEPHGGFFMFHYGWGTHFERIAYTTVTRQLRIVPRRYGTQRHTLRNVTQQLTRKCRQSDDALHQVPPCYDCQHHHFSTTLMPLKLPPTPGRPVSELRLQLEARLSEILEARNNGYTSDQIAEALGAEGITVSGMKLRTYLSRINKRSAKASPSNQATPTGSERPRTFSLKKGPVS